MIEEEAEDWEPWETKGEWFEADTDEAAEIMWDVFKNRDDCRAKGMTASNFVKSITWESEAKEAKSVLQGYQNARTN